MKKEKVVIYGTGGTAQFYVDTDFDTEKFELIAFCDGNPEKWEKRFKGYIVCSPQELGTLDFDIIIIASVFYDEISKMLIRNYGIVPKRIKNIYYGQLEGIRKRYDDYYNLNHLKKKDKTHVTVDQKERMVIYTAIAGDYDNLREPSYVDPYCDYICYTDNYNLKSKIWEIRPLPDWNGDFNRSAKQVKILPHKFLPEYQWSIWVDGAFEIQGNLRALLNTYALNSYFLSFMHYRRNSVYKEAEILAKAGFDDKNLIAKQIIKYKAEGYPDCNELIAGGVLFRKHQEDAVFRLMEAWWNEIEEYSRRDQISFNYCAWKKRMIFDMIDENIYENKYLKSFPHNRKKVNSK